MNLKILYIEDNLENTTLVRRVLEAEGMTVIAAVDGEDGLKRARAEKPDLILMDLHLPEMDGYEATTQLKNTPELKQIPV
ncbi:MAG: response regulator, partial [Deltaproteobacteria bacterium]